MPANGQVNRLVDASGQPLRQFGYDVTDDSKKRRKPAPVQLKSEDKHQTTVQRKKLVGGARDLVRNYAVAAWAIRKHLDYVSRFSFQARSPNETFNQRLEELIKWWSLKDNFDVAGRHPMNRFLRLQEARKTLDGDFGTLKLSSGRVQAIEGDRVCSPSSGQGSLPPGVDPADVVHGVWVTRSGRAKGYCLCNRSKRGQGFEFDRIVPTRHMLWQGYYERFDQVRGVGLIAPGIATLQDTYETLTYAIAKAKIAQLFGIKLTRSSDEDEAIGDLTTTTDSEGDLDKSATEIDLGGGPFLLDLDEHGLENAEVMESAHPAMETQDFLKLLIQISLKALDIPFSFFDEKYTNYSGARQAWLLYDQSAEEKRDGNREYLNALMTWRIGLWIINNVLELPKSLRIEEIVWEFVASRIPWLQPDKEVKADGEAVDRGFTSTVRVCKRAGLDAHEVADEEAKFQAYRQKTFQAALGETADEPEEETEDDDADD